MKTVDWRRDGQSTLCKPHKVYFAMADGMGWTREQERTSRHFELAGQER